MDALTCQALFLRRYEIDLGQRDDDLFHVEVPEDLQMFECLRHHAVIRRDHQQEQFHAGCARQHVVQKALVTGNVNDPSLDPVIEAQVRKTQIQRHPAHLLFEPAIGIGAGERLHQ